jgi:hypothetical protein
MDQYLGQTQDIMLGQEFLTWLWYSSEKTNGVFRLRDGQDITIFVERRVSVQGGEGDNVETATVSGAMSELREAKLGLATGKKVNRALVRIERDVEAWQTTLKSDDFTFSGFKTPAIESGKEDGDDPDAIFLEKIYLIERALGFIDEVYRQFLELRLGSRWIEEVKALRVWIEKG